MTKDISVGTLVVISPTACYYDSSTFKFYPVTFTPTVDNSYWIESFRVDDGNYTVTINSRSEVNRYLVHYSYVSRYKEEQEMVVKFYEKTYESFVAWAKEHDQSYTVYAFEEAVRESNPNAGEVWAVNYYGSTEYQRMNEEGMWLSAEGYYIQDQEEVKPIKKVGVDE